MHICHILKHTSAILLEVVSACAQLRSRQYALLTYEFTENIIFEQDYYSYLAHFINSIF